MIRSSNPRTKFQPRPHFCGWGIFFAACDADAWWWRLVHFVMFGLKLHNSSWLLCGCTTRLPKAARAVQYEAWRAGRVQMAYECVAVVEVQTEPIVHPRPI